MSVHLSDLTLNDDDISQAQLEKLQGEIAQVAKKTGIASAAKLATLQPKEEVVSIMKCTIISHIMDNICHVQFLVWCAKQYFQ